MSAVRRSLIANAAVLAVAAAVLADSPAEATITTCGRVADRHYSFRVVAHGERAPSCRSARRVARRAVGNQIERPLPVLKWACTADYYYEDPWSFLCIRRGTFGQVSIDRFHRRRHAGGACGMRTGDVFLARAAFRLFVRATDGLPLVNPARELDRAGLNAGG